MKWRQRAENIKAIADMVVDSCDDGGIVSAFDWLAEKEKRNGFTRRPNKPNLVDCKPEAG
jgi:hypothetical protein